VRHYLRTGAISPASRGVVEATVSAALIAPRRLPTPHLAGLKTAVSGAVDLTPIATTANQRLPAAKGAQEKATAIAVFKVAPALDALVNPWTRSASGAIIPRQSCSGTVLGRGAELNGQVRSAPRLVQ
jgi:hypothetical protein